MTNEESDGTDYKYSTGRDSSADFDVQYDRDQTDDTEEESEEPEEDNVSEEVQEVIDEIENDVDEEEESDEESAKEQQEESDDDSNEKDETHRTPYRDDALYMTEHTPTRDVIEFLRRCIADPVEDGDMVVWNFSTHEMDEEALDALKEKEQDHFVIPYQVTGAWGFMFSLLPQEIREAEILVYDPKEGHYMAYRSLYRTTADERMEQIRQDLSRRMVAASGETLGLIE